MRLGIKFDRGVAISKTILHDASERVVKKNITKLDFNDMRAPCASCEFIAFQAGYTDIEEFQARFGVEAIKREIAEVQEQLRRQCTIVGVEGRLRQYRADTRPCKNQVSNAEAHTGFPYLGLRERHDRKVSSFE